jgi:CelD/BcsL family acetyltransferase involved in cellulose biosynthesis
VAFGDAKWKPCAPGLLLMERTAHHMAAQGIQRVDLSIGSYDYKRHFGCSQRALLETCVALNWRGAAYAAAWQLKQQASQRAVRQEPPASG